MSDVLIKGMEMPKKGEYRMTLYVCDDGYAYMDVDLFPVDKDRFEAVPVPSHGRLGDLDKAYKDALTQVSLAFVSHNKEQAAMAVANVISNAPTIIPADPEEEEMK